MKETKPVPENAGLYALYLKKQEGGNISGSFLPEKGGETVPFSSLSRMVLLMDQDMDVPREGEVQGYAQNPDFELEILFRRNSSWQGRLYRPGNPNAQLFRSVLELLTLLESDMTE